MILFLNNAQENEVLGFPLRISPVNVTKPQFPVDLVTFTGEIINEKFHFFVH